MKRYSILIITLLFLILSFSISNAQPQHPYIAAAADGPNATSNLSQMAGRAPFFVFFDTLGNFTGSQKNPFLADRGAGPKVAQYLVNKGIKVITAQDFGGHMQSFMLSSGIKVVTFQGKASDAVKYILNKK